MDVDLVALGGDLVNFPSPQSVDDLYHELMKLLDEDELGSVGQQQWWWVESLKNALLFLRWGIGGESIDSEVAWVMMSLWGYTSHSCILLGIMIGT